MGPQDLLTALIAMDVNKDMFGVYAFYAGVVTLKMVLMSFATARQRFKKLVFISEEDIVGQAKAKMGVDPDVERVRRAHLNDIENIVPFLILGFLYLFTQPSVATPLTCTGFLLELGSCTPLSTFCRFLSQLALSPSLRELESIFTWVQDYHNIHVTFQSLYGLQDYDN